MQLGASTPGDGPNPIARGHDAHANRPAVRLAGRAIDVAPCSGERGTSRFPKLAASFTLVAWPPLSVPLDAAGWIAETVGAASAVPARHDKSHRNSRPSYLSGPFFLSPLAGPLAAVLRWPVGVSRHIGVSAPRRLVPISRLFLPARRSRLDRRDCERRVGPPRRGLLFSLTLGGWLLPCVGRLFLRYPQSPAGATLLEPRLTSARLTEWQNLAPGHHTPAAISSATVRTPGT